jgi:hypothetical protein
MSFSATPFVSNLIGSRLVLETLKIGFHPSAAPIAIWTISSSPDFGLRILAKMQYGSLSHAAPTGWGEPGKSIPCPSSNSSSPDFCISSLNSGIAKRIISLQ